jgi:DNA-binding transcriptional ArsR family regulator
VDAAIAGDRVVAQLAAGPCRVAPNSIESWCPAHIPPDCRSELSYILYYLRMDADMQLARPIDEDQVRLVVEVFRMLADPTRVRVLWALADGEMSVNELAEHIGKPAPSVSQHLAKLRMARLVRTRRAGTTIFYSLENEHVQRLVVDAVFNAEHAGPGIPAHHQPAGGVRRLEDGQDPPRQAQRR